MMTTNQDNLKIVSYNCQGILNKTAIIADICDSCDILLLQETWLLPFDLGVLNRIDNEFCSHSLSAVDVSRPLIGRPYGGVSIMWRKSIGESCKIVTYNDTRLLGIQVAFSHRELLLLNVYLPYFSLENYDNYLYYIGEIDSILECSLCDDIAIFGDFNAAVGGPYFNEWNYLYDEREFIFSDVH